jgi:membrane fusion protein (multidrug efflux system)
MFEAKRRFLSASSACIVCASLLPLLIAGCSQKPAHQMQQQAFGPMPLTVIAAKQQNVPVYGKWVGTLAGYVDAQISPEVSGYLVRQDYREGSTVHKGQVLFEIDPRPFQADLDKANGALQQVQAQLQLAEINLHRDRPLAQAHAIAQSQLDNDIQQVAADKAAIESAKASVETAQLNLGFTKVRSLITGIAGLAHIQVGNLVSPTSVLTTVSQVNPIKVYFGISEQEYLELSQRAHAGGKSDLLNSGSVVPLQLTLANGQVYPYKGRIVFVDRAVDPQTGTLKVAGSFPNPHGLLRPGQFGNVKAETMVLQHAIVVPQQALNEVQGTYDLAVVTPENKVHIQPVKLGPQVGDMQVIESGLKPGDHVAVESVGKLREGMPVKPHLVETAPSDLGQTQTSEGN